jgi:hypothetical protein
MDTTQQLQSQLRRLLLDSSKSSDSTAKRFYRSIAREIKKLDIGDAYENVLERVLESRRDTEILDKYRYPLRDDKKYKYVLREEIPIDKLSKFRNFLCLNTSPGVFEVLFDNKIKIDYINLAKHPDAFTNLTRKEIYYYMNKRIEAGEWNTLCDNTHPFVIKTLAQKIREKGIDFNTEDYIKLANNPNPEAIKLVEQRIKDIKNVPIDEHKKLIYCLCNNPTTEAIELLKSDQFAMFLLEDQRRRPHSYWNTLLANPKAMKIIKDMCKFNDTDDEWDQLQRNPNPEAFTLLSKKRSGNIIYNYLYLSENASSRAIKILKEKMDREKLLSRDVYYNELQKNPLNFLNWRIISKNPRAKSLILAKIKEERREEEISEDVKNRIPQRNLDWDSVFKNPAIFKRTRKLTHDKEKELEKAKEIKLYIYPDIQPLVDIPTVKRRI